MDLGEAIAAIRKLADADDGLRAASAKFEQACLVLARTWAEQELAGFHCDFGFRAKRPIDITISIRRDPLPIAPGRRIDRGSQNHARDEVYFIECKFYGRSLGLEVLGKSYLMALRFKPIGLVIASNRPPTDIACDFAEWVSAQAGGNLAITYWNPLDERWDAPRPYRIQNQDAVSEYNERFTQPFRIESWSLWRDGPFGPMPVARSIGTSSIHSIDVLPDETLIFHATLTSSALHRERFSGEFLLGRGEDAIRLPLAIKRISAGGLEVRGTVSAGGLIPGRLYEQGALSIGSSAGEDILSLGDAFPSLFQPAEAIQLPDLRQGIADGLYSSWTRARGEPVLTVRGEGGIGKTYLCECIGRLAGSDGYHVARSLLTVETGIGFISEFLWLLLPSRIRHEMKSLADVTLTEDFIRMVVGHASKDVDNRIFEALAQLLLTKRWPDGDIEPIMQTIARLLVNSTTPLMFFVGNCQRIADAPANALKALLAALEQEGWGHVRVVLEFRDTPEDIGDSWRSILVWMDKTIGHRRRDVAVGPLDDAALGRSLRQLLVAPDIDEATALIIRKAGGNPLYLTNLLRALVDNRLLTRLPTSPASLSRRFSLDSLPAVQRFVAELSPHVETLLRDRIAFWHEHGDDGSRIGAFALGLNAVFSASLRPSVLAKFFRVSVREIELTLMRFKAAGLLTRIAEDEFAYSHEFARSAALKWFDCNPDNYVVARTAAEAEVPEVYSMALAKGRINARIGRVERAVEAFNAAVQLAGGDFGRMLPCYKEMADQLEAANDRASGSSYHAAIEKTISIGYYLLSQREIIALNRAGLSHLDRGGRVMQAAMVSGLRRYYNHTISNVALRLMDLDTYEEHANSAIDYCRNELEMAQILNRLVKVAAMVGAWSTGREAGLLATALQKNVDQAEDQALYNVLYGEMAVLYVQFDPLAAAAIVGKMLARPVEERQEAHDLIGAAGVFLACGDRAAAAAHLAKADALVTRLSLESLRTSAGFLQGVLDLMQQRPRAAADVFKRWSLEAAWRDNVRDEIRCGANLLVARIAYGDFAGASDIYERLLVLARAVVSRLRPDRLTPLLTRACAFTDRALTVGKLSDQDRQIYPPAPADYGADILQVFFYNASILNNWRPDMFAPPNLWFGRGAAPATPDILPRSSIDVPIDAGFTLKAVC